MNWRSNSASGFHPRTVSRYRQRGPLPQPHPRQRCLTFVRNHAKAIVACDFLVVVTARFRLLPTADWTLQQFREAPAGDHSYRFVIHDRDSIFSGELDEGVTAMSVRVLRTPVRAPKANSVC